MTHTRVRLSMVAWAAGLALLAAAAVERPSAAEASTTLERPATAETSTKLERPATAETSTGAEIAAAAETSAEAETTIQAQFHWDVRFETSPRVVAAWKAGSYLEWTEGYLLGRPGEPALPSVPLRFVLPVGTRAVGAEITPLETDEIPVGHLVALQPPAILNLPGTFAQSPPTVPPSPEIYALETPFPARLASDVAMEWTPAGAVASLIAHPVQYLPHRGVLHFHRALRVTLQLAATKPGERPPLSRNAAGGSDAPSGWSDPAIAALRAIVCNPDALEAPLGARESHDGIGRAIPRDPQAFEYVIITPVALVGAFQPLAEWKTQKGVPATVITTEQIEADYPALDQAASIRAFLQAADAQWGTRYVLLGGDTGRVQARWAWAMDCEAGFAPDENEIPADLYYSDLDGSWDANGDGIYGQVADSVDLYPDLYVGRIPASGVVEATTCVDKILAYERTPAAGYACEALFCAEVLWNSPYTDSGIGKDLIDELHFAPRFQPITKLYESLGNENRTAVLAALDAGPHFVNHAGHAWYSQMCVGDGSLYPGDADALANGDRTFLIYSMGCWSAALDYDAIAEHFLTAPGGGAFAFVGNSRYGWGSPGNPGMGYSETFDRDFYGAILSDGITQLGPALAAAKTRIIPYGRNENVYRIHLYQVNLLGDPETPVYTRDPLALTIETPDAIPVGTALLTLHARNAEGPVAGARICIAGNAEVYHVGVTDAAGRLTAELSTATPQTLTVTATAQDHRCAETLVTVSDQAGTYLTIAGTELDDIAEGNGNGDLNPAETVSVRVELRNAGVLAATGVSGLLTCADPRIALLDATAAWPDLPPGAEALSIDSVAFTIAPDFPAGACAEFTLEISDGEAGRTVRSEPLRLLVVLPLPELAQLRIYELSGDGDGDAEPGETVALGLTLRNAGNGTLSGASATLASSNGLLVIDEADAQLEAPLLAQDEALLVPFFAATIDPAAPEPYVFPLTLTVSATEGVWELDAALIVGEVGLSEDVETGAPGWTHAGTNDQWHISTYRAHSGAASWYCGDAGERLYPNNSNAALTSPWVTLPQDAVLRFWRYFNVTLYGNDGLFIELDDGTGFQALGYLGSGGALDPLDDSDDGMLFLSDWAEVMIPLDAWAGGTQVQVRFRLVTDSADRDEGFYLDDIVIGTGEVGIAGADEDPLMPAAMHLAQPHPNPSREAAQIRFTLARPGRVRLEICDVTGRRVQRWMQQSCRAGSHTIIWNGRDARGALVGSGVYYIHLNAAGRRQTRSLIRIQ
ncbi:MAG: hypothetical protein KAY32_06985 [Candidatus Eisenbacteria sp.]|nr:hypothetical protein [Candidatus Eisenbacteria bacterium]